MLGIPSRFERSDRCELQMGRRPPGNQALTKNRSHGQVAVRLLPSYSPPLVSLSASVRSRGVHHEIHRVGDLCIPGRFSDVGGDVGETVERALGLHAGDLREGDQALVSFSLKVPGESEARIVVEVLVLSSALAELASCGTGLLS